MLMHPTRSSGPTGRCRAAQGGLSMVELLVGVAVGLLVVAAAAMLTATQLGDNRRLLLETQVQQDLRAALDTVNREVRRSGSRFPTPSDFVWTPTADGTLSATGVEVATPLTGISTQINYKYNRYDFQTGSGSNMPGFRLNSSRVQFRLSGLNTWSDLTDTKAVTITGFTIEAHHQDEPTPPAPDPQQRIPCPNLCQPGNDTSCWPTVKVRDFVVTLAGTAVSDAAVSRSLRAVIRPRNDQVVVSVSSPAVCPA